MNAIAVILVLASGLPFSIKLAATLMLFAAVYYCIRQPSPHPQFRLLVYDGSQWILTDNQDNTVFFERHRVIFETGLFFVLELRQEKRYQLLVIFFDQMVEDQYRVLKIIEKIN